MARILVVDDEIGIRELLSEILYDEGHTVELAENAAQARAARLRARPDLVLLDIWMPDTDGVSLLKEWASQGLLDMPVIMMSGHATVDTAVEATRIGAVDFLEKPFNETDLRTIVARMLDQASERVSQAQAQKNHQAVLSRLTAREQQVLERIVAGRLNKQIAGDLNISIKTVEAHRANIMEKLEVTTVADLMKIALTKAEGTA